MERDAEAFESERQGSELATDGMLTEVQSLITSLQRQAVTLRLVGGVAVRLRCPSATLPALKRTYADVDFMAYKKQSRILHDALTASNYTADRRFNAMHGDRRLLFYDEHERHIDIFLDVFEMCHKLPLERRLELHPFTLSPADLLLTKLQIVQLNKKDILDTLALLLNFPPAETAQNPGEELDVQTIATLCAQDWGWFTTVSDSLERIGKEAVQLLNEDESAQVTHRIEVIKTRMINTPKSSKWRLRAVAGRRIPWYELPEEIG